MYERREKKIIVGISRRACARVYGRRGGRRNEEKMSKRGGGALENNKWHSKQIWTVFYCSGFARNG